MADPDPDAPRLQEDTLAGAPAPAPADGLLGDLDDLPGAPAPALEDALGGITVGSGAALLSAPLCYKLEEVCKAMKQPSFDCATSTFEGAPACRARGR